MKKQSKAAAAPKKSTDSSAQKIDVKDKYQDGEMDLSMCDLQDVPVKNIATFKKLFSLDLSSNRIIVLPQNFATLTNLVKLDLSKNQLKELPENFGELTKLKHLDLYKNQLQHLPLSFSKLQSLKWLDLKDNPLMPKIAQIAGPCLDAKQCQTCAKNVVVFYVKLQKQVQQEKENRDQQRQKSLQQKEANAQKQKQQEKKDKKKQKQNKTAVEGTKSKAANGVVAKKTETKSKKKSKPVRKNWFLRFFLNLFAFLFVASLVLFIATSLDLSYTKNVEGFVAQTWKIGVGYLPVEFQTAAVQFEQYFTHVHNVTGNEITKVFDTFLKIKQ